MSKLPLICLLAFTVAFLMVNPANSAMTPTSPVTWGAAEITQDGTSDGTTKTTAAGNLNAEEDVTDYRSWIDWDTSSIPDNATITRVELRYKTTLTWSATEKGQFRSMTATGASQTAAGVLADIAAGALYYETAASLATNTWFTSNLGAQACTDLQSHLAADWFSVGFKSAAVTTNPINIYSENTAGSEPILYVYYYYTAYHYTVYGVYYENGTRATGISSTVTFYSPDATDVETITDEYSGITYGFDNEPIMFSYTIDSGAAVRNQYPAAATGSIYIFEPEDTYDAYEFTIKDYINALSGEVYLKSSRVINGTAYTIERMKVTDSITAVALQLTVGKVYSLEVTTSMGYTFDAGYFIPASDTTGTISLRWPTFSQQAQLTYRYITVEATRPTSTSIRVEVNNTLAYTYNMTLIEVWVNYRNGTNAYYVNSTVSPLAYTMTWMGATNTTDYDVYVEVTHDYFGLLRYEQSLSGAATWIAAPDLSVFGSVGDMDVSNLLPVIIIFVSGGLVSTLSVGLGAFTVAALAGAFTFMGWWTMSDTFLYTCLALAMLVIISERRNQ